MKLENMKLTRSCFLMLLTALMLTALGCQKAEEATVKTVSAETLSATYQTEITELLDGDFVQITRHADPLRLVKLNDKSFYKVLNDKISRRLS